MMQHQINQSMDYLTIGFQQHTDGNYQEAELAYACVLQEDQQQGDALHALGLLKQTQGCLAEAQLYLEKAFQLYPDVWRYAYSYGQFCAEIGHLEQAETALQIVVLLKPDDADAWYQLGNVRYKLKSYSAAITAYQNVIAVQDYQCPALNNLALAFEMLGDQQQAYTILQQGLAISDTYLPIINNLGNLLLTMGRVDEALLVFEKGLSLTAEASDLAEFWFNYANALAKLQPSLTAITAYNKALLLNPEHEKAKLNLANCLKLMGITQTAIALYQQVLESNPDSYDAYNNLGVCLQSISEIDAAKEILNQAIKIKPEHSTAYNNLGNVYKEAGQIDQAIQAYRTSLDLNPYEIEVHSNLVYALNFQPDLSQAELFNELSLLAARHTAQIATQVLDPDKNPERCLKIAYLSPDFREHCQSLFTWPLFSHHDHAQFKIYCYSLVATPDTRTEQIKLLVDVWRDGYAKSDAELAQMIAADQIDILIDLSMHMANGRPLVFARKPAPIQVAWLAYPGSTGLPTMAYRLTDPWLDPENLFAGAYTEQSIRLPNSFWCYDPLCTEPKVNRLPALSNQYITFGCLNNFCKVSDQSLQLWGEIMAKTPNSRLILLAAPGQHRLRVYQILSAYGISQQRIEFFSYRPRLDYLTTYHAIDICLDTLPYNGHTTSLDAYWMGVPVVSLVGNSVVGRAGWSQLNNLGLPELAAFTETDFIKTALELAHDLPKLVQLRQTLRERLAASPLMDAKNFTLAIEKIYRQIWRNWCLAQN